MLLFLRKQSLEENTGALPIEEQNRIAEQLAPLQTSFGPMKQSPLLINNAQPHVKIKAHDTFALKCRFRPVS